MARPADAAARVRRRILDWLKSEGHGSKSRLAAAVAAKYGSHKSKSWATSIQKAPEDGGQDVRLKDLDAVAHLLGMPPGELVSDFEHVYLELTMAERRLVEFYRAMPDVVRGHWMRWIDYLFHFHRPAPSDQGRPQRRRRPKKTPAAALPPPADGAA